VIRVAVIAAATAGLAYPSFAQAPAPKPSKVFAHFQDLCLENNAIREAVVDEAGRKGWAMRMEQAPPRGDTFNARTFVGTGPADGLMMVLSDRGAEPGVQVCSVTGAPKGNEAVAAEVRQWVGFPDNPKHRRGSVVNYFYVDRDGRRVSVADATPEQQKAMLKDGSLRILWVSATKQAATISLSTPRPSVAMSSGQ
jgi:hypothetical protein